MLAVFGTAIDARGPRLGGLVIGLVVTMDVFAGFRLTGAAMNPARAFGPALVDNFWSDHLVYWIGPIIGAVVAALVYHYAFMDGQETVPAM
jgi:glycerol uptake facilitator-like aquaporin